MFAWLALNAIGALPLALLALALRRFGRPRPGLEHFLWLLVLVRLVVPPVSLSFLSGGAPAGAAQGSSSSPILSSAAPSLGDVLVARATRLFGPDWSSVASRVLLAAFLSALLFFLVRELVRIAAVERCVRRARPAPAELAAHVRAVAAGLGVPTPRVRLLPEAAGPFLWSLRRPVLVLPAAAPLPAATVIAHELAHLRRRDHWTSRLELLVQALHFWNPLYWLARRGLHRAAELACDQWVVTRFPGQRRAFARALLETAERAAGASFVPRAVQALGTDSRDFEERLVRILRAEARVRAPRAFAAGAVAVALLTLPGLALPSLAEFRARLPALPVGRDLAAWGESLARADARLAAQPNDGAAEMQRGIALLCLARPAEALAAFERQAELGHQRPQAHYNQACAFVRLDELEAALVQLVHAADLGLDVAAYAAVDPDLAPLRAHPDFADVAAR